MTSNCIINDNSPLEISQLIQICVNLFDDDVKSESFPSAFFHAHEWIIDSVELMARFISLYQELTSQPAQQLSLCRAVGYWLNTCPTHFEAAVCKLVEHLQKLALADGIPNAAKLLDISCLPSYPWLRNSSLRNPVGRQISLSFEQWSAEDISTSLSHIDYKALYRIPISELKRYCKDGNLSSTPILKQSISIFNSLSNWVQCMILSKSSPSERAEIMTKFINVGKYLKLLNNYNTLMAVIGGVTHSSIARLSKTMSCLTSDMKKDLSSLTQLLSSESNFANYWSVLKDTSDSFRVPIMGVHLKDLIAFHCKGGNMDRYRTYSCNQILKLAKLLSFFVSFNRMPHNFPNASIDLINTLKVSLDIRYDEDDIYHLSLKREPRTLLRPTKSVVFADWASGVCSAPDPENINKHISAMVEAVFKHYDHDKDGYISQTEFHQIAGNFPFIAPFGTIDVDRDGQISKSEMKDYFMQLNKHSMDFRREFKHNFQETSFLTPISCAHCGKLVWGFIRGFKCKDCEVVVHAYCKDSAVVECRRQSSSLTLLRVSAPSSVKQTKKLFLNSPDDDALPSLACEEVFDDISPCLSVGDFNSVDASVR
ncbi:unnamed protein product [Dracunculus medinensis]|uniref:Phorbol-ester/DAG-type domain-containing protein n=1 Tax=Dracunculus medinensis TaxID=318479 RepID=A0A0N4UJF1_DRAME|nr:unnamed protein product [Dracunculus medinensis]